MIIFIVYLASTSTTTPPYCAPTCTGNHTNYSNATTCGLTCVDTGSFMCQNASTFCAGGNFFNNVTNCDAGSGHGPCSAGYCCVYDTYSSTNPYLCLSCISSG